MKTVSAAVPADVKAEATAVLAARDISMAALPLRSGKVADLTANAQIEAHHKRHQATRSLIAISTNTCWPRPYNQPTKGN